MKLSKTEEQLMGYLWRADKASLKDLLAFYPEPRPAVTTIATLLKRMTDKGYIAYTADVGARVYYPLMAKKTYFSQHLRGLIDRFFNKSSSQFASFFTEETGLTDEELLELRELIDKRIEQNKS